MHPSASLEKTTVNRGESYSEQVLRQVSPVVDAAVHGDETVQSGFVPHVWVVQARVQHNYGKGKHVTCVCGENRRK